MEERLAMSKREIDRYHILKQVQDKKLRQKAACGLLGLKERQIRFKEIWTKGLDF